MEDVRFNRSQRWRLVLGKKAEEEDQIALSAEGMEIDAALDALYESGQKGGLGNSAPKVNRWLGDIRKYFPSQVVQVMQKDALENLGLKQMLLEPEMLESVDADVHLVGTLLSLNSVIPSKTKETARLVVRKVVEDLKKRLEYPLLEAIKGALNQAVRNRRPKFKEINWGKTIRANLKHYQTEYKTIIPHQLIGYGKKGQALKEIILCIDQSGSMASSVVYSSIFAAVLASLPAIKTHMVVFDTAVADLTKDMDDPVDLLFGTQLGGGTDIHKALNYVETLVRNPEDTILILISDLYEGGNEEKMLQQAKKIQKKGVNFISLLALSDEGAPIYDKQVAARYANLNIPVFACTPDLFPSMMAAALKKEDMYLWMAKNDIVKR
ncbi:MULTISPECIES: VWA domain-containing protein [unclassified Aureispira]|uniref:vWA domain-containing protein n=1 Tax=unclassified Aureispira TaxID=2649989 RepID=UPI0006974D49|nr:MULTISPECIES: VWA domain-containing protein [unclassified Aureispira]WMX12285.1 VWA domain-containing protein [Aureispira sp. CCB-E]